MIRKKIRETLTVVLSLILVVATTRVYAYQAQPATADSENSGVNQPAPKSAKELQALVAPIALYPDALVAQILSAATFPDEIPEAYQWLQDHKNLSGKELADAANKESWDPSVKAVTQFPSVIENMNKNLAWTSELGEAYHIQPKDVMAAVQVLRAQAKAAGNLKTTSQMTVVQQSPDVIVIQPANPQIVYVPTYNPTVIYGTPYTVPGYTAGDVAAAAVIGFGAGIAIGSLMSSSYGWGWNSWGCSWHGGAVVYNRNVYYGNAAWHGGYGAYGYHGYGTAYRGAYGSAAAYHGYGPGGAYHTGGAYRTAYGGASRQTTYGPGGGVHTSGSGYSNVTGQGYHYGATRTAAGGTAYHGMTSTGQHIAGGTTAGGQHWGGAWGGDSGWSARAASDRGWSSSRFSGGFHGGGFHGRR